MAARPKWWVIPGALLVLLRLLTLDAPAPAAGPNAMPAVASPRAAQPAPAAAAPLAPAAREASGRRQLELPLGLADGALVLVMPAERRGERVALTIWRRVGGAREAEAWLQGRPKVRADGTLPIAGLAAGHYDVEVRTDDGRRFAANGVAAPARVQL